MPDWFYRTCARPILFRLPDHVARALALGVIGHLGRSRAGRSVIEFLGHTAVHPERAVRLGDSEFASPIGLSWRVDPECRATMGLGCFGVGCVETRTDAPWRIERADGEVLLEEETIAPVDAAAGSAEGVMVLVRHVDDRGREFVRLPDGRELQVKAWNERVEAMGFPLTGIVLQVGVRGSGGKWKIPASMPLTLPDQVREWRRTLPPGAPLIVTGGVGCPSEACALVEAGADLILLDAGLVFHGPGLVKRCNEALHKSAGALGTTSEREPLFRRASFWSAALGVSLMLGGAMALVLAMSRVLLPYDEQFLGFSADVLRRNSPRLFAFMAHDRGTLAGTMLGLGWLYFTLARNERHGTKTAVVASALAGFASFFGFFGFGYFDTLHAFVAAVLLQFTIQIMVGRDEGERETASILDIEDAAWRRAQWAQLLWVIHSLGLLIAGGVILGIGMTSVFVSEDLNFLCVTQEEARKLSAQIIGVVAHDRATLGGMLLASGVAMLLPVLWCFRRGERWLWNAVVGLGLPAYGSALAVHLAVGYVDWRHMVPAIAGLVLWVGGLLLSRGYLAGPSE